MEDENYCEYTCNAVARWVDTYCRHFTGHPGPGAHYTAATLADHAVDLLAEGLGLDLNDVPEVPVHDETKERLHNAITRKIRDARGYSALMADGWGRDAVRALVRCFTR